MADIAEEVVSRNAFEKMRLMSAGSFSDVDARMLKPLQLEDIVNGAVCKRPADFRTPRRKHHEYKMQRISSKVIESLNLESVRESHGGGYATYVRAGSACALPSLTSEQSLPTSSGDQLMLPSVRSIISITSSDGSHITSPPMNRDEVNAMEISRRSTIQNVLCDEAMLTKQRTRLLSIEAAGDITAPGKGCPPEPLTLQDVDGGLGVPGFMKGAQNSSSCMSTTVVERNAAGSVYSQTDESGYVESDCEAYCVARKDWKNPPIALDALISTASAGSLNEFEMVKCEPAVKKGKALPKGCYTYSPNAHFGVLRLFLQGNKPNARQGDAASMPSRVVVNKSPFIIGCDPSCDLSFDKEKHRYLYKKHCKIVFTEYETKDEELKVLGMIAYKVDLHKINPDATVFVNGVQVRNKIQLKNGDSLCLCPKKLGITFTVAFRSREACVALLNQLDSLMLTPADQLPLPEKTTPLYEAVELGPGHEYNVSQGELDMEFDVIVSVFELYYGDPGIELANTPTSGLLPEGFDAAERNDDGAAEGENGGLTPLCAKVGMLRVKVEEEVDMSSNQCYQPTGLAAKPSSKDFCPTPVNLMSNLYTDDVNAPGNLLLSAYTTDMKKCNGDDVVVAPLWGTDQNDKDDSFKRLEAHKIAKLRALNTHAFPIVVDSSRSLCSERASACITVQRLRYLGHVKATYQTTMTELLPCIQQLIHGNGEGEVSQEDFVPSFDVLLKRKEEPLSEDECRYNWVFQLDFFDKDDPLFRRAIYASQKNVESDKTRLRALVDTILEQLNRSRVLYVQNKML